MAIGSLDQAGRLDQLRTYAAVQVRSGYRSAADVHDDVFEAVLDEVSDRARAHDLTVEYLRIARAEWADEAASWPSETDFDRLQAAFAELAEAHVVVLEAVDDHWEVSRVLSERAKDGAAPRGAAYFTHTDVWHAVEHGMLEVNLWHGSQANVTDSDQLLTEVLALFDRHGLQAHFDEGRIELKIRWQRRPLS